MSSFKRKGTAAPTTLHPPGSRASASASTVSTVSTGIPSFDDVLGGGIPLGSVVLVLTPDLYSAWGMLLQRYYIAQGISANQSTYVLSDNAKALVDGSMWLSASKSLEKDDNSTEGEGSDAKIKIAWRYEKMQQFQTSVASSSGSNYCDTFDLTTKIPSSVVNDAMESQRISYLDVSTDGGAFSSALDRLRDILASGDYGRDNVESGKPSSALRLAIPDLGSPSWGDASLTDILRFIRTVRHLIQSTTVSAFITLSPHLSSSSPLLTLSSLPLEKNEHWIQQLSFVSDGCLSFTSFGSDPTLTSLAQTYHGSVQVHRSPSLHTLLPPAHRYSQLRGLQASHHHTSSISSSHNVGQSRGGGENNLAFRCTRKRFVIETLHLDAEGGVGERRTSKPASAHVDEPVHSHSHAHYLHDEGQGGKVAIQLEVVEDVKPNSTSPALNADSSQVAESVVTKPKKAKKSVAFRSDRPDLYDF